jgi:hypothetical protein
MNVERTIRFRAVKTPAGDREGLNDQPGVALIGHPRIGVETVTELGCDS